MTDASVSEQRDREFDNFLYRSSRFRRFVEDIIRDLAAGKVPVDLDAPGDVVQQIKGLFNWRWSSLDADRMEVFLRRVNEAAGKERLRHLGRVGLSEEVQGAATTFELVLDDGNVIHISFGPYADPFEIDET